MIHVNTRIRNGLCLFFLANLSVIYLCFLTFPHIDKRRFFCYNTVYKNKHKQRKMKQQTLPTIGETFEFKRPVSVYKEMYTMDASPRRTLGKQTSIFSSIVISFIIVATLGWFFYSLSSQLAGANIRTIAHNIFGVEQVHAAHGGVEVKVRDEGYSARYVGQSIPDPIVLKQGETKTVNFRFRNTGTHTWDAGSPRYISGYTMAPRYHASAFQGANWLDIRQTAKISGTVAPGQTGTLPLQITAKAGHPPGEYTEHFYLAADGYSWVKGGLFYVKIKVVPSETAEVLPPTTPPPTETPAMGGVRGEQVGLSRETASVRGGEAIKIVTLYENTGSKSWNGYQLVPEGGGTAFVDESWDASSRIVRKSSSIAPGSFIRETFIIRAPAKKGTYTFRAVLKTNDVTIVEPIVVRVEVTANAPSSYTPPVDNNSGNGDSTKPQPIIPATPQLAEEPSVRVGLLPTTGKPLESVFFLSRDDDYRVFNGSTEVGILEEGNTAEMSYAQGTYSFIGGSVAFRTNERIRLEPVNNEEAVFEMPGFIREVRWVGASTYNAYVGVFELQVGKNDGKLYVINETPMEHYVAGITETGDLAPEEFMKANLVAARTYAHINRGKYPYFDVLGSTYDQLYLGHRAAEIRPHTVDATEDTRGMMVVYGGSPVFTPYFGHSDGSTKKVSEVWGGSDQPWLQPVKTEYDDRDYDDMFGHGVGMSQHDASERAKAEGLNYVEILQYYYTGIEVEQMYR